MTYGKCCEGKEQRTKNKNIRALVYSDHVEEVTFNLKSKEGGEIHRALVYERLIYIYLFKALKLGECCLS